jgi:hypothetical protein
MDILGDRKYVEIPGNKTHELPPLLVRSGPEPSRLEKVMGAAARLVEDEDLISDVASEAALDNDIERRKLDLAVNLVEQYMGLLVHWNWGDSVLEWIRQCEITFESRLELRVLLRPDIWPHAGRKSFVTLLTDKTLPAEEVNLERAVGLRLTFRQAPPISIFSNQFLFYLKSPIASAAYTTWASMSPEPIASLPPERFWFEVVRM